MKNVTLKRNFCGDTIKIITYRDWVVRCKGKTVDMFHTKKQAVEFAKVKFMSEGCK